MSQIELDLFLSTVGSENDIQFCNGDHEDLSKTIKSAGANFKDSHVNQSQAKSFVTGSKKWKAF